MKRLLAVGVVLTLAVVVVGCGSSPTTAPPPPPLKGEAEVKEMLALKKEADELGTKDQAKAMDLLPKMMAASLKLEALKLTEAELKALCEKYPDFEKIKDNKRRPPRGRRPIASLSPR
jgi:hypothetical protein